MKFAHNAKQRGVEYPSVDNKVTQRVLYRLEAWTEWRWITIYSGKLQSHTWVRMYLSTCEKFPIQLYGKITLVKLPGYVPCAAIPLWNKNDLFTLQSSHFYSRKKSVPKGSYAGVTGCCCAWKRGLRSSSATSPCGTPAGCCSPSINLHMVDSAFSLATPSGLPLFRKPLKKQQARNPGRQEN